MSTASNNPQAVSGATTEVGDGSSDVRGTVRIAPAVLIELIDLTVQGVSGFAGLRSRRSPIEREPDPSSRTYDNGKIAVTVSGDQIDVAVAIAIWRGTNVAELTTDIQRRIGFAAGNMLGMTVRTVDIYIEEIMSGTAPA